MHNTEFETLNAIDNRIISDVAVDLHPPRSPASDIIFSSARNITIGYIRSNRDNSAAISCTTITLVAVLHTREVITLGLA